MSAGSVCSFQSNGIRSQNSSNGSRKSKANSYKTISHKSYVDDSLFGEPNHIKMRKAGLNKKETQDDENIKSYGGINKSNSNGPKNKSKLAKDESVRIITKDMVRDLKVPREDPSELSTVLNYHDYLRLKEHSKIKTKEDLLKLEAELKAIKEKEMMESQKRRQEMKQFDIVRKQNDKMSDLEEEAYQKAQVLLQKANRQREEQEDEIKKLNELMLNAKIQAIRDLQILEKQVIKKENVEEEERLDQMMEVDRVNSIVVQSEIEKKRKEEEYLAATEIIRQIEDNEQERLIELERKDQENKLERERISKLMEEEIAKRRLIRDRQQQLRDDLNEANDQMLEKREKEKELEKLLDLRVLEIQKEKAEREAEIEAEAARIKAEKEKEVARLRALQERARDEQSERDELRARRAMEDAEREWRRKEMDEIMKKKVTEEDLMRSRAEQAEMKEHFMAIQAARDRSEFERSLKVQKELMERERELVEQQNRKRSLYSNEIRKQIRENEEVRIAERNNFFKEGEKLEEEAKLRRHRLEEAKNRKMEELRNAGIPDKFLQQIERKAQMSQKESV